VEVTEFDYSINTFQASLIINGMLLLGIGYYYNFVKIGDFIFDNAGFGNLAL